jgi:hypothetical protein
MQSFPRYNVDVAPEQVSKLDDQRGLIEEASASLQLDQQIDVAVGARFPASHRAEHTHRRCPVKARDPQDRAATPAEIGEGLLAARRPIREEPIDRPAERPSDARKLVGPDLAPPAFDLRHRRPVEKDQFAEPAL